MQNYVAKDNRIFVGLEDSKLTWKLCVRCDGMMVHETSMPAEYDNLHSYLRVGLLMVRYDLCMKPVSAVCSFMMLS